MVHLIVNAYWEQLQFEVPLLADFPGHEWKRWIDTALDAPEDICTWEEAPVIRKSYIVRPRSSVVLIAQLTEHGKL